MLENLDKYYAYAKKIAGDLGEDLLHYLIAEKNLIEKTSSENCKHVDSYVYTALRNEFYSKTDKFNKIYRPNNDTDFDDTPSGGYDSVAMHTILLKLEIEGYNMEVKVFKECYLLNSNEYDFSRRSKTDRRSIENICKFVKNEIKERYVIEFD